MDYLGQLIELVEQESGWIGVWFHPCYVIELGFFPTAQSAWEAATELVRRDLAVRSIVLLLDEWYEQTLISPFEQERLEASLSQFVFEEK